MAKGSGRAEGIHLLPLRGLPEVTEGADLTALLLAAAGNPPVHSLQPNDVIVVTHKIVAKAEGCSVDLRGVEPSPFAQAIAAKWGKDARQVEVVLRESSRIVRMDHGVLICETRHGFICANAGVDRSNTAHPDTVVTLPRDPDASARAIREGITRQAGVYVAVIVCDTFGRPWREGLTNVAIGCAGLRPLRDERGNIDAQGYVLAATVLATADALAAAAELVMGKLDGVPAAIVRGYAYEQGEGSARELLRASDKDMFR